MARVLHVTQPTAGGVAGVVIALAALQQREGWNVTVASPATEPFVARPTLVAALLVLFARSVVTNLTISSRRRGRSIHARRSGPGQWTSR
jgi:hypothetical protein